MTAEESMERNKREKELDLGLSDMRRNPYLVSMGQASGRATVRQASGRAPVGQASGRAAVRQASARRPAGSVGGKVRPISQNRKYAANSQHAADGTHTATGNPEANREHTAGRQHAAARRRARLRKQRIRRLKFGILLALTGTMAVFAVVLTLKLFDRPDVDGSVMPGMSDVANVLEDAFGERIQGISASAYAKHPDWTEDFLTPNEFSRPGDSLGKVKNIFVHYTANPGTSAAQNRSYFEQLKDTQERSASAHFIIGYEGEIIQCVPLDEIAYAVQTRNMDSVSIECCYLAQDGSFTQETYDSLLTLLRWLLDTYHLDEQDILRHYDCGGKKCPLYYTEHEEAWEQLKRDVKSL